MNFLCQLGIRGLCLTLVPVKLGRAHVGSSCCSDKDPCQQVLDSKRCPQASPADVQATWLPDIHCWFTENLAKAWHLAHLIFF